MKVASIAVAIIGIGFLLHLCLPYSFAHFRQIETLRLVVRVKGWKAGDDLERTQQYDGVRLYKTNLVFQGATYAIVARRDSDTLRGRGHLAATADLKATSHSLSEGYSDGGRHCAHQNIDWTMLPDKSN